MNTMSEHSEADLKKLAFGDDLTVDDIDLDQEEVYVGGQRLTNDRADELTEGVLAEAERQGLRPGLQPGGKSLSGDGSKSPVLQIPVSWDMKAALEEDSGAAGMKVPKFVRGIIDEWYERRAQ